MASFDELNRMLSASYTQQGSPNRGGTGNPGGVHNTSPRPTSPGAYDVAAYRNTYGAQNPQLGRYRPPTMGGDGSDPGNWNDFGGYAYNLPNNFGPVQTSWTYPGRTQRPGERGIDHYLQIGREADRNLQAELANGSAVARQGVGRDGQPITRYIRPGQQQGGFAWGSPEAYAQWQANRDAMSGRMDDVMYAGGSPGMGRAGRNSGEAPPTSGSPYRAPRETHVGGASAGKPPPVPENTGKPPPTVDGGTKGPMPVEEQMAALEDWEFRRNRGRGNRWGRY